MATERCRVVSVRFHHAAGDEYVIVELDSANGVLSASFSADTAPRLGAEYNVTIQEIVPLNRRPPIVV